MTESVASSDVDEVSSVTSSHISRKSKASFITVDSIFSAKAKEAAKKAELLIKEQKLKLEFEQEQFELRTQLQIVNAREKALTDNLNQEIGRSLDTYTHIRSKSPQLPVDQV
ncbi:hypothetical protein SNE40_023461 [Patella caerulea]|uniref:Uncharacterized protein n=1 Tax=Patella caerulea TaxID=87958 RepID=A0AAN8J463_PATCE